MRTFYLYNRTYMYTGKLPSIWTGILNHTQVSKAGGAGMLGPIASPLVDRVKLRKTVHLWCCCQDWPAWQLLFPATENILSDGVDVAGIQSILFASLANLGYLEVFCCQNWRMPIFLGASVKYSSNSAWGDESTTHGNIPSSRESMSVVAQSVTPVCGSLAIGSCAFMALRKFFTLSACVPLYARHLIWGLRAPAARSRSFSSPTLNLISITWPIMRLASLILLGSPLCCTKCFCSRAGINL